MTKTDKKKIEKEIIDAISELLSHHNKAAVAGMSKSIKLSARLLSKRFNKVVKNSRKEAAKKKKAAIKRRTKAKKKK